MTPVTGQSEEAPQKVRQEAGGERGSRGTMQRIGRNQEEGQEQKRRPRRKKTGEERSNSERQMEPGTETPMQQMWLLLQGTNGGVCEAYLYSGHVW